jgi:hypothetical protein
LPQKEIETGKNRKMPPKKFSFSSNKSVSNRPKMNKITFPNPEYEKQPGRGKQ